MHRLLANPKEAKGERHQGRREREAADIRPARRWGNVGGETIAGGCRWLAGGDGAPVQIVEPVPGHEGCARAAPGGDLAPELRVILRVGVSQPVGLGSEVETED